MLGTHTIEREKQISELINTKTAWALCAESGPLNEEKGCSPLRGVTEQIVIMLGRSHSLIRH